MKTLNKNFGLLDIVSVSSQRISTFDGERDYIATGDVIHSSIYGGQKITYENRPSRADLIMTDGEVLFAKMKDTVKVLIGSPETKDKIFSTGFYILKPKENISQKFLYFYFLSDLFNKQKNYYCTGATMSALTNEGLKKITIGIPVDKNGKSDLAEQERIVAILEEAEKLKQKRAEADQKMSELIPALFVKMFGDPISNPKQWDIVALSELGSLDRGKSQHRPRTAPELFGGHYPFVQTGDITNAGWRIKKYTQTYSEKGLAQSRLWSKNTLCITIAANIAKTAILDFEACFPDSVVGFIADENSNPDYVQGLFHFYQQVLEEAAPKAAQRNINLQILRNLKVPKPPVSLQNQFAEAVKEIEAQKEKQKQSAVQISSLFSSLLAKSYG